jgi:hypothetical protein
MKIIFASILFFEFIFNINGQKVSFFVEPILSFNERIIIAPSSKQKLINSYEVPTTSGGLNLLFRNANKKLQFGFGYQRLRYGTRKYAWPDSIRNITPQGVYVKDRIVTNQMSVFVMHNLIHFKNGDNLFIKYALLMNKKSHFIRQSYFANGEKGIKSFDSNTDIPKHNWDGSISFGYAHQQKIRSLGTTRVSVFLNAYILPYQTGESYYFYLPVRYGTSGFLWSFGASWAFKVF